MSTPIMPSPPPSLSRVKHIIVVLSGKGGVGKSTVACQLAMSLAHNEPGSKVGILDVDICGPSVPKICGVETKSVVQADDGKWEPVQLFDDEGATKSLKVMSIAYLLPSANDAVVWRGPRKDAMIKQFINDVDWGALDYLIVDTPPGTSDEHLTLCELINQWSPTGAVIVTTPQQVSTDDVEKELSFCHKLKLRCLGIVENMSGFVCPNCAECTNIFSKGGGERLAKKYETPFLGSIPIDPALSLAQDKGQCVAVVEHAGEAGEKPLSSATAAASVVAVIGKIKEQIARVDGLPAPQASS
jgi:Mrp family chromosome partitioning ATPase